MPKLLYQFIYFLSNIFFSKFAYNGLFGSLSEVSKENQQFQNGSFRIGLFLYFQCWFAVFDRQQRRYILLIIQSKQEILCPTNQGGYIFSRNLIFTPFYAIVHTVRSPSPRFHSYRNSQVTGLICPLCVGIKCYVYRKLLILYLIDCRSSIIIIP